jgi:hypothetical protein
MPLISCPEAIDEAYQFRPKADGQSEHLDFVVASGQKMAQLMDKKDGY